MISATEENTCQMSFVPDVNHIFGQRFTKENVNALQLCFHGCRRFYEMQTIFSDRNGTIL